MDVNFIQIEVLSCQRYFIFVHFCFIHIFLNFQARNVVKVSHSTLMLYLRIFGDKTDVAIIFHVGNGRQSLVWFSRDLALSPMAMYFCLVA